MWRVFLLVVLMAAGCGKTEPVVTAATGASTGPGTLAGGEKLPPSEPLALGTQPVFDRVPSAGTYRFARVEPSNLWIEALPVKVAGLKENAEIQLDRLYYPLPSEPSPAGLRQKVVEAIGTAIQKELAKGGEFRFVPTVGMYAGPGQVGGIIYLPNGHTMQDVLISQGLARVNQNREGQFRVAVLANPLVDYWLECEARAKKEGRGFWTSQPELMRRNWDAIKD